LRGGAQKHRKRCLTVRVVDNSQGSLYVPFRAEGFPSTFHFWGLTVAHFRRCRAIEVSRSSGVSGCCVIRDSRQMDAPPVGEAQFSPLFRAGVRRRVLLVRPGQLRAGELRGKEMCLNTGRPGLTGRSDGVARSGSMLQAIDAATDRGESSSRGTGPGNNAGLKVPSPGGFHLVAGSAPASAGWPRRALGTGGRRKRGDGERKA